MIRLSQAARQLNVAISTIVSSLSAKGFKVDNNPNTKISTEQYNMLAKEFKSSAMERKEATNLTIKKHSENVVFDSNYNNNFDKKDHEAEEEFFVPVPVPVIEKEPQVNKKEEVIVEEKPKAEPETIEISAPKVQGLKILGKIDLNAKKTGQVQEKKAVNNIVKGIDSKETSYNPDENKVKTEPLEAKNIDEPKKDLKKVENNIEEKEAKDIPLVTEIKHTKENVNVDDVSNKNIETEVVDKQPDPKNKEVNNEVKKEAVAETLVVEKPVVNEVSENESDDDLTNEVVRAKGETLKGLTVLGKIVLPVKAKGVKIEEESDASKKRKRKRKRMKVDNKPEGVKDPNTTTTTTTPVGQRTNTSSNNNVNRTNTGNNQRTNTNNTNRTNTTGNTRLNTNNTTTGNNTNTNRPVNTSTTSNTTGGGTGGTSSTANKSGFRDNKKKGKPFEQISSKEIQGNIKSTLAKMGTNKGTGKSKRSKFNRSKDDNSDSEGGEIKLLKVTEFISASDMAVLMNVSINEVISTCLSLGMFVSINQRLDAEAITVIADEFDYAVEFISAEDEIEAPIGQVDTEESLITRAPIVTIMGHVDHGKTSLLDYIRKSKVAAGEAGGITQHVGAYDVVTETNRRIVFLDTPGHEAFTAMRSRGAKMTDVVVIVVAADDNVMPQTKEAINHALVAGVPIIIAINKIDKAGADPERIRKELAEMNILVEEWGGKYQSQEISAKSGIGISELLEKILLESDILDLKANPEKKAVGTVIEASLDKGRGYVTNVLVQSGTLYVGDVILAGSHFGRVKAMMDHRGNRLKSAVPSTPVQVLGLSGAPQAGDKFNAMDTEREAREIATRREQIIREQNIRTRRHLTLEEIGRRKALGNFSELNIIVKGDVDGSVEALSDSLLKLSTEEIQVNIVHKGVGAISESDVTLASVSDAIIVGFQVRPTVNSRKIAEQEQIEIRFYSIIYDAINEVKDAMEGMLAPKLEEAILGNIEVRDVFKISKLGTIAGCYVTDGNIKRNNKIRVLREGIVVHTGDIDSLKRYKDDVSEVKFGFECGISLKSFNDIEVGDTIESFEIREIKRTL